MPGEGTTSARAAARGGGGAETAAALQTGADWNAVTTAVLADLGLSGPADALILFIDGRFADHYAAIVERLVRGTEARHSIGCTGQAVIGSAFEAEGEPAISVLALRVPGAEFTPVAVVPGQVGDDTFAPVAAHPEALWLLFADPFSVAADRLVAALEDRVPGVQLVGGLASARGGAAQTAVFLDGQVYPGGAALLGLRGVAVHTIVAQGAEPIGQPWIVTACEHNVVHTLGSRPALEVLHETLAGLDEPTRQRAERNLLVGLAMNEYQDEHGRGDFLIRNVAGVDRDRGALAINEHPRVGQTFQFQVRDAAAADEDLRVQLQAFRGRLGGETVLGSLLCSCNGRGQGLFGVAHHDAAALAEVLGAVPTAGFFCNGEIGPVGRRIFLHGFTASIAVLTAPASEA